MSINVLKNNFNITTNIIDKSIQLKDLKYNNKFIEKIYYCNKSLFPNLPNNSALIYKKNKIKLTFYKCSISFSCYDMLTAD